jgi:PAS domain S-box-containing protein
MLPWSVAAETLSAAPAPHVSPTRLFANVEGTWLPEGGWARAALGAAVLVLLGLSVLAYQQARLRRQQRQLERERALAAERRRSAAVLEGTTDLVLFASANQIVTFVNVAGRRLLGWSAEESSGAHALPAIWTGTATGAWNDVVLPALRQQPVWTGQMEVTDAAGRRIPVTVVAMAHRFEEGTVDFYSVTARDITGLLQAESAKREAAGMLQVVTDSIPIHLALIGPDERFRWLNRAYEVTQAQPVSQLVGKSVRELQGDTGYALMLPHLKRAIAGETVRFEHVVPGTDPARIFESTFLPQISAAGEPNGLLAIGVDVTERRQGEHVRRRLEDQLRQRQKLESLGTLAGGIAHDFNNLLTSMLGNAELARMNPADQPEVLRALDEIVRAGQRARETVRQILAFGRNHESRLELVDVGPVVEEAVRFLRSTLPSTIRLEARTGRCPPTMADPTQLHQVVMNLCTNAAQALADQHGYIMVTVDVRDVDPAQAARREGLKPGRYVVLQVTDTGVGMDDETQRRIFDPFFTTKPVGQGTGLGLAVVHGIVQAHGGTVTVHSSPGAGATFRVYLPLVETSKLVRPATPPPATAAPSEMARGDGRRLLIVDDEPGVLQLGMTMARRLGYSVVAEQNPDMALERFRHAPNDFDLVLTDLTMPGRTGMELARDLHAIRPQIPIVLATGYAGTITEESARQMGFCGLLNKPYRFGELASALDEAARIGRAEESVSG